jgi:hypothetical protein
LVAKISTVSPQVAAKVIPKFPPLSEATGAFRLLPFVASISVTDGLELLSSAAQEFDDVSV